MTQSIEAMSWEDILMYYIDVTHHGHQQMAMVDLIMFILDNKLTHNLYAYPSLTTIIISNVNPIDPLNRCLHINHQPDKTLYTFSYFRNYQEKPTFERRYSDEVINLKFQHFVRTVSW
jgi:hypothetical protein